uniref:Ubiquitin-like modifier-activating enzyme ATG7 n=1 Tax=Setaria digitata TaxID=48799 RepID=A0A915Q2D5_9BILA
MVGRTENGSEADEQSAESESCVYYIKWVDVEGVDYAVVMQNENGPCPLLAVINVLLLRGQITLPCGSTQVSQKKLLQFVADCILRLKPKDIDDAELPNYEQNVSDVLTLIPSLPKGLDVNIHFTGVKKFEYTPACALFDILNIPLVHGWIIDQGDQELLKIMDGLSYNRIVEKIVTTNNESENCLLRNFLDSSASQLTTQGIAELLSNLNEGEIAVLFRNNHFQTLAKQKDALYVLVTDMGFLGESAVVWETLDCVDGNSTFVDAVFSVSNKPEIVANENTEQVHFMLVGLYSLTLFFNLQTSSQLFFEKMKVWLIWQQSPHCRHEIGLYSEEYDVQDEVPRGRALSLSTQAVRPHKNYNRTSKGLKVHVLQFPSYSLDLITEHKRTMLVKDPGTSSTRLSISYDAFLVKSEWHRNVVPVSGSVLAVNTHETFRNLDRKQILYSVAEKVKQCIESLEWLERPSLLNTFYLTVYPDLKKYTFRYWNCIPALLYPQAVRMLSNPTQISAELATSIQMFKALHHNEAFLLVGTTPAPLSSIVSNNFAWSSDIHIVYPDPSTLTAFPGWPLRNLLAAVAYVRKDLRNAKFICYRSGGVPSIIIHLSWETASDLSTAAVGWERIKGSLTPAFINLRGSLDPLKLMEFSAELNLRLIRWRLVPNINLQRLMNLKCLILGAGTLGCNVARSLLAWGVKNFTFVDDARISYSNVVRQSLFSFDDAANGGKFKALTAAEGLRKINPLISAEGICMKIPMPGHSVPQQEEKEVEKTVRHLENLVKQHDVTFLLLDSREARWLPTLMTTFHHKLAISVALGFDCFVVIRHGVSDDEVDEGSEQSQNDPNIVPGSQLGCYFCSDVTAPGNSSLDRTMDQQCTVSRAGISSAASGAAVELLAAVVQHPKMGGSPARLGENDESTTVLGATPHQIRSFLSRFTQASF